MKDGLTDANRQGAHEQEIDGQRQPAAQAGEGGAQRNQGHAQQCDSPAEHQGQRRGAEHMKIQARFDTGVDAPQHHQRDTGPEQEIEPPGLQQGGQRAAAQGEEEQDEGACMGQPEPRDRKKGVRNVHLQIPGRCQ